VIGAVCLSVCLSVSRITEKVMIQFHCAYQLGELIIGGDPIPDMDSGSLFLFPRHCGVEDFRRFTSVSHTVTGRFLRNLRND